jgi:hypothetical protein
VSVGTPSLKLCKGLINGKTGKVVRGGEEMVCGALKVRGTTRSRIRKENRIRSLSIRQLLRGRLIIRCVRCVVSFAKEKASQTCRNH